MPKVSVIIPTYNRSKSISRTINSVLNQTYTDFEIIIVNDNSNDNTETIINSFLNSDPRLRYIKHNVNKGGPASRNTGIKNSNGKYIALLDDDDEWYPEKLEKQVHLLDNSSDDVGLIYCGCETADKHGNIISKTYPKKRGNLFYDLLGNNFIPSPTNLIRKECFDKIGFCDETLKSRQDLDLWVRISNYYQIDYISEILTRRNVSDVSISGNINSVLAGHLLFLEKYKYDICKNRKLHSNYLKNIGIYHAYIKNYSVSKQYLKQSLECEPLNIPCLINYLTITVFKKPAGSFLMSNKKFVGKPNLWRRF